MDHWPLAVALDPVLVEDLVVGLEDPGVAEDLRRVDDPLLALALLRVKPRELVLDDVGRVAMVGQIHPHVPVGAVAADVDVADVAGL